MRIFFDSSALVKRYIPEAGAETVDARCREAEEIVLSVICVTELISVFNRLKREGKFSHSKYLQLKTHFNSDLEQATLLDLTPSVIERVIYCMEKVPLSTLDAIHVASAMECACDLFITADRRQYEAAIRLHVRAEAVAKLLH